MQDNEPIETEIEDSGSRSARRGGIVGEMREKWARSKWSVFAIFLAFALAGMTTLRISRPLLRLILGDEPPRWLWWTLRILLIVPIYEMVLVGWGTVLGQGEFFRSKLKKTLRRISSLFARRARA